MKASGVVTVFGFLLIGARIRAVENSLVDNFIANSDKTIAVVTFGHDQNFSIPDTKNFVFLDFQSENVNLSETDIVDCPESWSELDSDFIIFVPSSRLRWAVDCLVNGYEKFLFYVVDDELQQPEIELLKIFSGNWLKKKNFKVFIAIGDLTYFFDPFFNVDGSFGKLISSSDFKTKMPSNLNGYQINVEMFESTYTMAKIKKPKFLEDFQGPDVEAAMFIRDRLNATSLFKFWFSSEHF